jgi:hypothetical protein
MNAIRHNSPKVIRFRIDTTHTEPASDTLGTADNTLPSDSCLDIERIDTDLDEPFSENISEFTSAEIVICEPPQVTYAHDTGIVDTNPCAIVELMNRRRHK